MWGAIWNGAPDGRPRRLKGKFDYVDDARSALELAAAEGKYSEKWYPPDGEWQTSKAGGYYRRLDGTVVSVKKAKSGAWYATLAGAVLGQQGRPTWFQAPEDAQRAVEVFAQGNLMCHL